MSLTVLGECQGRDLTHSVVLEVRHVELLLEVPDLDHVVAGPGTEDETVRVELESEKLVSKDWSSGVLPGRR